jgi:Na+-transporting NADH:ubiquinone oxidoreductase subunit NqrC
MTKCETSKAKVYYRVSAIISAIILSAAALHGRHSHAEGFTLDQQTAILFSVMAQYVGVNNRCPRFEMIQGEVDQELTDVGVIDLNSDEFRVAASAAFDLIISKYKDDPSEACSEAWKAFGPGGTYKRQMLREKTN